MAMPVVKASPQKRKHAEEYHDPDYPNQKNLQQNSQHDMNAMDTGPPYVKRKKEKETNCDNSGVRVSEEAQRLQKVCAIIEREFQKEINLKQQQLEEIDNRLTYAKQLLERLRYSIVAAYYRKQDLLLAPNDAATIRGSRTLFEREDRGPQMQIHPAIKSIISKKPRSMRPQRSAAQLAKETIRAKTDIEKKEERKRQKLIRQHGIVINHTEQDTVNQTTRTTLRTPAATTTVEAVPTINDKVICSPSKVRALNTTRLNNKLRHLIVVGNTSKYIGGEVENDNNNKSHGRHTCTHKWLVYVQSKDIQNPLERFVKKVRFYLHHSYRPNDVVDIHAPPYHISRRGWGEFPIRVQLFFHSEYHQKPVQLVHNIILDKTLTGIQTLGAETTLEIYLRNIEMNCQENNTEKKIGEREELAIPLKPVQQEISIKTEELLDDDTNLLEFLNKIEAIPVSADLEKINPTIGVLESLTTKLKTPSPIKDVLWNQPKIQMSPTNQNIRKTAENPLSIKTCPLGNTLDKGLNVTTPNEMTSPIIGPIFATTPASSSSTLLKSSTEATIATIATNSLIKSFENENTIESPSAVSTGFSHTQSPEKENIVQAGIVAQQCAATSVSKSPDKIMQPIASVAITTTSAIASKNNSKVTSVKSTAISSTTTTITTTTVATSMQQKVTSTIIQNSNAMAVKQSPILIINKNNHFTMPAATVASPVRRTILPIIKQNVNITTNNSISVSNVIKNGISTAATNFLNITSPNAITSTTNASTQRDLMLQPVMAINGNGISDSSPLLLKQYQRRIVKVVDCKGHVKYIPMLINTNNTNKCVTTVTTATTTIPTISIAAYQTTGITVKTADTNISTSANAITTTNATTSMITTPRIFNVVPSTTIRSINIVNNKMNQVVNSKNCMTMTNGTNSLSLNMKPTIVQIKSDAHLQQQSKPKVFTISTLAMGTIPTKTITTIAATIPKNIISLQIKSNKNVYSNHHYQQQNQQQQQQQKPKQILSMCDNNNHTAIVTTLAMLDKQPSSIIETSSSSSSLISNVTTSVTAITTTVTTTSAFENFNSIINTIGTNVLYKEGKLCIFDPIQMKLKQQQKKQISLLKPQISLLKQQQQQQQHKQMQQQTIKTDDYQTSITNVVNKCQQFDDSIKSTANYRELERMQVERKFFKQHFRNVQTAVEYLLKNTPISCSGDLNGNMNESSSLTSTTTWWLKFQSLPSIMQKSLEWLRAKQITKLLQKHKQLKELAEKGNNSNQLWTTREVVLFARQYHYTPPIKVKGNILQQQTMDFATLIKRELKQQQQKQQQQQCHALFTLNESIKLRNWLKKTWRKVMESESNSNNKCNEIDNNGNDDDDDDIEFVDIINVPSNVPMSATKSKALMHYNQKHNQWNKCNAMMLLRPPAHLENECVLVQDICKNTLKYQLEPEELQIGVLYPATLTILANCLHHFLEKLLRQTIAMKYQWTNPNNDDISSNNVHIFNRDIRQMLYYSTSVKEFDFLTNQHFTVNTVDRSYSAISKTTIVSKEDDKNMANGHKQSELEK